jgi:YspA, cpYpsA-related SLOG family
MRILVTGSRDWPYPEAVYRELSQASLNARVAGEIVTIVDGACPTGADSHAHKWTELVYATEVNSERHPADWNAEGRAAGPLRNQRMVALGADLCIAFRLNGSRGTTDCIQRAKAAGIPCRVIDLTIEKP